MVRYFVLPYQMHSEGAKAIAEGLGGLRIRLENSRYTPQHGDCVINWGNGYCAIEGALNKNVDICINKKKFFERMQGHNIVPSFAYSKAEVIRHLQFPIVCRTRIEGADGEGIVVAETPEQLVSASLFTQLMDKTAEYRVHLGRRYDGEIVLIAAQKKRLGTAHGSNPIWTGNNVFLDWCDPVDLPREVFDVTKRAMELMPELTFGGFDTIVTPSWGSRVVEVNSAPMMTPDTTRKYVEFFKTYVEMRDAAEIVPTGSTFDTPSDFEYVSESQVMDHLASGELSFSELVSGFLRNNR